MQLTPRYGADPIIQLEGSPSEIVAPFVRQRRRLADTLAGFSDEQWAHPSRCEAWTARDVVVHLDSTNSFWAFSIAAGLRGEPTRFLTTFDPVSSPAQLVSASTASNEEVLSSFTASTTALVDLLESLDGDQLQALAEGPPGHITISALAHHALWDSWVHERDILLPLDIAADEEADEIAGCLRYGSGLGPAFGIAQGCAEQGTLAVDVTGPEVAVLVSIDADRVLVSDTRGDADLVLTGDAVALLEALSIRRPLEQAIPSETAWMLRGLAEQFDVPVG